MSDVTWPEAFLGAFIALSGSGAVWAFCWMIARTEPVSTRTRESKLEQPLYVSGPAVTDQDLKKLERAIRRVQARQ